MKVIAINGSPKRDGNTAAVIQIMAEELICQSIETEVIHVGLGPVRGCTDCRFCSSAGQRCAFNDDIVNEASEKMRQADGIILGSPVYYGGIAGTMKCFLDRVFFSGSSYFRGKVAAAFVTVRRSGGVTTVQQLLNYLQLARTVSPPSQYWPAIHGGAPGEVLQDSEGMQTARHMARDMGWLLKAIAVGEPMPEHEPREWTNFIRGSI